jgi:hypothetical protein
MSSTTFKPFTGTDGSYGDARLEYESGKQPWVVHSYVCQLDVRGYGVDLEDGNRFRVGWTRHDSHLAFMESLVLAKKDGLVAAMTWREESNLLELTFKGLIDLAGYNGVKRVTFSFY